MVRSAVRKAQQYLERTTNQRRHTRLIIMSTCHIVFAEIADDTVRASSPSMLLSTMSGVQQSAGFRALCVILTSNCWPERMTSREEWKLPWEIILLILSNLDRRTVDALAHASTPVRMRCYPRTFQSQDIPQLANVGVMNYPLLIHCCGKRSGLEESGVMCSVCYSWQHTDCINLNALPSESSPRYICSRCRCSRPPHAPGPKDVRWYLQRGFYHVQHEGEPKRLSLQQNPCRCENHYYYDKPCLRNVDFTIRFDGAFSGLAYGLGDKTPGMGCYR